MSNQLIKNLIPLYKDLMLIYKNMCSVKKILFLILLFYFFWYPIKISWFLFVLTISVKSIVFRIFKTNREINLSSNVILLLNDITDFIAIKISQIEIRKLNIWNYIMNAVIYYSIYLIMGGSVKFFLVLTNFINEYVNNLNYLYRKKIKIKIYFTFKFIGISLREALISTYVKN